MNIISFLQPTNLASEKEKFLSSDSYNPQLTYAWSDEEITSWLNAEPVYQELVDAVRAQDMQRAAKAGETVFSTKIDDGVLAMAQEILTHRQQPFPPQKTEEIVRAFNQAFQFFDLDYTIEVRDEHGYNFRPMNQQNKIYVSKYATLQFFTIQGEVRHEMVHILRYVNTEFNNIPFSATYLPTEEGLASSLQDYGDSTGAASLYQHAAEYVVTKVCLQGSMRDAYDFFIGLGFSADLAWQRAIRHKFGMTDTSLPGDNMKPSMYFYWEQKIKVLRDDEKLRLFVGKISVEELESYPEYNGKISIEKLREFYQLG